MKAVIWVLTLPIKIICLILALSIGLLGIAVFPLYAFTVWLTGIAYFRQENPYEQIKRKKEE